MAALLALGGLIGLATGCAFIVGGQIWLGIAALGFGVLETVCAIKAAIKKSTAP